MFSFETSLAMGKTILSCIISWLAITNVAGFSLPTTYTPTQYNLLLTPNMASFTYSGTVEITIATSAAANESELSVISFHKDDNVIISISEVSLKDSSQKEIGVNSSLSYYIDSKITRVYPKELLTKGSTYTLKMSFTGKMRRDNKGLFLGSYLNNNSTSFYMGANFYPVYARLAFPCFDEPKYNAIFNVRITRKSSQVTVFNMPVASTITANDSVTDTFTTTPKMSPHSLSFFVADSESMYSESTTLKSGTKLKLWKPTTLTTNFTNKKFSSYIDFLEIILINHPLGDQNIFVLPDLQYEGFGGCGIIFLRDDILLPYYGHNSKQTVHSISVIFNQLLRQYFSNYVSPASWSDVWLTESIVTYLTYTAMNAPDGTWDSDVMQTNIPSEFSVIAQQQALSMDLLGPGIYGIYPLVENENIGTHRILGSVDDDLKKLKGAAILKMLDSAFAGLNGKTLLKTYLNSKPFSTSSTSDFLQLLSQNDATFSGMKTWFTKTGYPVISVSRNGSYVILQQILQEDSYSEIPTIWKIPITYTYASRPYTDWVKTAPEYWLTSVGLTFTSNVKSSEWMIFNKKSTGYYRVQYGTEDLQLIQNQLKSNYTVIDEINHAAIIDDLMYSVKTGAVSYKTALKFLIETSSHTRYYVWVSTLNALKFFKLSFYGQQAYDEFRTVLKNLLEYPYGELRYYRNISEPLTTTFLRGEILPWACEFEVGDCASIAKTLFDYLLNGTKPSTEMPTVYDTDVMMCEAFKNLSETQFQYYVSNYKANHEKNNRQYLIASGMGCVTNKNNINNVLVALTSKTIYEEDAEMVFTKTYLQPENVDAVIDHITNKTNVDILLLRYGLPLLLKVYRGISSQLYTQAQHEKLAIFLRSLYGEEKSLADKTIYATLYGVLTQTKRRLMWAEHVLEETQSKPAGNNTTGHNSASVLANNIFMLTLCLIVLNLVRKK